MSHQVIIVDDDPVVVLMMKHLIIRHELSAAPLVFRNGLEAIQFLEKDYTREENYIILLDLNMPVMDGWKFLEALKAFASPENTMVFIVTSSSDKTDKESVGTNEFVLDFFIKPIVSDTVLSLKVLIDKHLVNK
ncbi:MAG: response regulator [Cyclobacteriaceae bacterium]|nr:response regulator [Cyclobacteriaceae bacterium]